MADVNPYQAYLQNTPMMANHKELPALLYDGVLKFLGRAQKAIEAGEVPAAHEALIRAQEIINHLHATLDRNYEISADLAAIYEYCLRRLAEANLKKDAAIVAEVAALIKDLASTWRQAMARVGTNGAASGGS